MTTTDTTTIRDFLRVPRERREDGMMTTEQTIGTICHNEDDPHNPTHRRVELWVDADGTIWADRNNPHKPDVPRATGANDAIRIAQQAWHGSQWDFRPASPVAVSRA